MAGETLNPFPEPTLVPPQLPLYHCTVPPVPALPPFKVSVVLPPTQKLLAEAVAEVGLVAFVFTFTILDKVGTHPIASLIVTV